jgi:hypothetical protein
MNTVNYRPILPDDNYQQTKSDNFKPQTTREDVCININDEEDVVNPDVKKKRQLVPVKLTQNKVLLVGLFVVLVIIVIAIVVTVIKHRKEAAENNKKLDIDDNSPNTEIHKNTQNENYENTQNENYENKQNENYEKKQMEEKKTIDNYILRQYMEKRKQTPVSENTPVSAMGGRQKIVKQKLPVVEEDDSEEFVDKEYSKTREVIGGLLNEYDKDYDDAMVTPPEETVSSEKKYTSTIEDESLEEVSVDGEEEEQVVRLCESVLISGKRVGQQCERKCTDGSNICGRHNKVKE